MSDYLANVKFLVADDTVFMRQVIRTVLKTFGAQVIMEATDGREAYEMAKQSPPDMALINWEMQPVSGIQFVEMVRTANDSPNRFMPVIMVTGYSQKERVIAARDAGVNDFVVKPISASALLNRIQGIIDHPRGFAKTEDYFGPDRRRRDVKFKGEDRRTGEAEVISAEDQDEAVLLDVEQPSQENEEAAADKGDETADEETVEAAAATEEAGKEETAEEEAS